VDGTLTIIDGEPGRGKTLEAMRLMIASARAGRNIAHNIALLPAGIDALHKINPSLRLFHIADAEIPEFWKHVPKNCDIYIDEAHLMWSSKDWAKNRTPEMMSYISQFRKDGDSIWALCQYFGNLDKFIRDRATTVIHCRRVSIPKLLSKKWGGRPIIFVVRTGKIQAGNEVKGGIGWPRIYTPDMVNHLYPLYDTRGKVDESNTFKRKTIEEFMPTIQTPSTAPAAGTANPTVVVNTHAPDKPKKKDDGYSISLRSSSPRRSGSMNTRQKNQNRSTSTRAYRPESNKRSVGHTSTGPAA
jgi:hypothetical protein